jgi:16S rRNA (adenine(1408)-N(1))-methyltransferase
MEIIRGKKTSFMDTWTLAERTAGYGTIHIDLGTGDGRFVKHSAQTYPKCFVIGIDSCRENLQAVSRDDAANALFVIANAQTLPSELNGLAGQVTINFPWGSLVEGLLNHDLSLLHGLVSVMQPNAKLEVHLNGGALANCGWSLEDGAKQVRNVLRENGFDMRQPVLMAARDLQSCPTTWAKRLAFGRDPRALYLAGVRK